RLRLRHRRPLRAGAVPLRRPHRHRGGVPGRVRAGGHPGDLVLGSGSHYVSQPPSPKATLALLHRVEEALDIEVPLGTLPEQAEEWVQTVTEMADEDEDVRNYVRALEERGDAEVNLTEASGDAIAA